LYTIIAKQPHGALLKKCLCSNLKQSTLTCASNTHASESATQPVPGSIKAVRSCAHPSIRRAIL